MKMRLTLKHLKTQATDQSDAHRFSVSDRLDDARITMYNQKTDLEIWSAFKNGDEVAFNFIYRKYSPELFNFGYQVTDKVELIRDCMQNLFIDIRRRRKSLSNVVSIKSYLYKCLYRELVKKLEKERKYVFDPGFLEEKGFEVEVSHETKMINNEFSAEVKQKLKGAINKLTVKQRKVILLFYEEGLPYKEIADIMGLKDVKSARKILYRAIAGVRKEIIADNSGKGKTFLYALILSLVSLSGFW